jgi:hypothetical protein
MANALTLPMFIEAMYQIVNKGYDNHELSFDTDESLRECVRMHRDGKTFNQWYISKTWTSIWGNTWETFKHNWTEPRRLSPTHKDYIKFWQVVNQFSLLAYNIEEKHWESSKDNNIDHQIKNIKNRINDIKNEHDQDSTGAGNPFLVQI